MFIHKYVFCDGKEQVVCFPPFTQHKFKTCTAFFFEGCFVSCNNLYLVPAVSAAIQHWHISYVCDNFGCAVYGGENEKNKPNSCNSGCTTLTVEDCLLRTIERATHPPQTEID